MTIDEAIKNLENAKAKGAKAIIMAWWDAELFQKQDDHEWQAIAEQVESQMDWSSTHYDLSDLISELED
jgi:epoxyqueuosine reductase QueG